jgi:hypothetical protein
MQKNNGAAMAINRFAEDPWAMIHGSDVSPESMVSVGSFCVFGE